MKVHEFVTALEAHNPEAELVFGKTFEGPAIHLLDDVERPGEAEGWHIAGSHGRPVVLIHPGPSVRIDNDPAPTPAEVVISAKAARYIQECLVDEGYSKRGAAFRLLNGEELDV